MNKIDDKKEEAIYNFEKEEMILRDFLAADRTVLANERTLLSYIRTGISLIVVGISLIKLFDDIFTYILGVIFMIASVFQIIIGIIRYKKMNKKIENVIFK